MPIKFYRSQGLYGEFSSFYLAPIEVDDVTWPTSAHYYQAQKFVGLPEAEQIRATPHPDEAKRLALHSPNRPADWVTVKDEAMRIVVWAKFTQHACLRDCMLNRALIDRETNQRISDRAPSDYLAEMRKTRDFPFKSVLTSHTLPIEPDAVLFNDDYERFLIWRQAQLWQEIQRVTGITMAADLEADDNNNA